MTEALHTREEEVVRHLLQRGAYFCPVGPEELPKGPALEALIDKGLVRQAITSIPGDPAPAYLLTHRGYLIAKGARP
ncbi:MAG: hypothetical protein ACLFSR_03855 [Halomonas sp.]